MKITANIECSPEEARRFLGLPDMGPVHDTYLDKVKRTIDEGVTPDMIQALVRTWGPMSEGGMLVWRQLFDQLAGSSKKSD